MDINFFQHWWMPQAIPHWRGTTQEWTQSPSPTRWRHQVTFSDKRAPSLEESPKHDIKTDEAYPLPPPTWQTREAANKMANWLRPREEARTIPGKGDADLKCPLPLEPHLQQLLSGEEPSPAGAEVGGSLLPMVTSLPPLSMPKDPEPSTLHASDWIGWWARHVQMPSWWGSSQRSLVTKTTKNLPRMCMPPSRCLRHATGQRGWITTMHNCQCIPPSESTALFHWRTWVLAPKTSVSASYIIPLPMQGPYSIGPRRHNPQSLANLIIWWECTRALVGNGLAHCFGEGDVFITMVLSRWMEITLPQSMKAAPPEPQRVAPTAAEPTQGDPYLQPTAKVSLLSLPCGLPERQKYQLLNPGSLCCSSPHLTTSPHVLHPGLWRFHKPCRHPMWGGDKPLQGHGDSCDGDLASLTSYYWWGAHWYPVLFQMVCWPGAQPHGGWLPGPDPSGTVWFW